MMSTSEIRRWMTFLIIINLVGIMISVFQLGILDSVQQALLSS